MSVAGLRPDLAALGVYRRPAPAAPVALRLDANVPLGPDGLRSEGEGDYPDARALEETLAARWGVPPDHVVVTAGGDDALDRVARAFLGPGRRAVVHTPGFEMFPRYARIAGGEVVEVPWVAGPLPVAGLLAAARGASLVVLTSPNNPTGLAATREELIALARGLEGVPLVLDAVYGPFADEDLVPLALSLDSVVVIGSLSKGWAAPGLRVGWAVSGRSRWIDGLRAAGAPYPVAQPSLTRAQDLLEDDARQAALVAEVRSERGRLRGQLLQRGFVVEPSQASFVLARATGPGGPNRARFLREGLASLGIATRGFDGARAPEVRIGCPGRASAFSRLQRALDTTLAPEALLLDLDGVLADVSLSYRQAIVATCAQLGAAVDDGMVAAAKRQGAANDDWELTRRLLAAGGREVPLAEVTEVFERVYQGSAQAPGLWRHERLCVGTATLERLSTRLPLAIVTGRPRADAERFLEQTGVARCFAAVVAREDAPALKPDPAPLVTALRQLGASRAWMVGDTVDDVRAAAAAGAVPLGIVAPGGDPVLDGAALLAAGAARVIEDVNDLEELLP